MLGRKVDFVKMFKSMKLGDVPVTYAFTVLLQEAVEFRPEVSIREQWKIGM